MRSAVLVLLLMGSLSCSGSKDQREEKGWEEATTAPLTMEESLPPVAEPEEEPCTYATYKSNNALLASTDAPCNQGTEPLSAFLVSFRRDAGVVRSRTLLPSGITPPHVAEDPFRIITPDSTGYFASWIIIERDTASFLHRIPRLGHPGAVHLRPGVPGRQVVPHRLLQRRHAGQYQRVRRLRGLSGGQCAGEYVIDFA